MWGDNAQKQILQICVAKSKTKNSSGAYRILQFSSVAYFLIFADELHFEIEKKSWIIHMVCLVLVEAGAI